MSLTIGGHVRNSYIGRYWYTSVYPCVDPFYILFCNCITINWRAKIFCACPIHGVHYWIKSAQLKQKGTSKPYNFLVWALFYSFGMWAHTKQNSYSQIKSCHSVNFIWRIGVPELPRQQHHWHLKFPLDLFQGNFAVQDKDRSNSQNNMSFSIVQVG